MRSKPAFIILVLLTFLLSFGWAISPARAATIAQVNFQDPGTTPPPGYVRDFGEPYGLRNGANQGAGTLTYGWVVPGTNTPLDLSVGGTTPGNGRNRGTPADVRLATLMHMQADDLPGSFNGTKAEGAWEMEVPNGTYTVTVSVGDSIATNSTHTIHVEGIPTINDFVPSAGNVFASGTVTINVNDGRLTVDALSGINTKINYIIIEDAVGPAQPFALGTNPANGATGVELNSSISTSVLALPNGPIDSATVSDSTVYLYPTAGDPVADKVAVSSLNTTGGGDAITLTPAVSLAPNTQYTFVITGGVQDVTGASFIPYSATFTTAAIVPPTPVGILFNKVDTGITSRGYTSLAINGDKLYATTNAGQIYHWTIGADGALSNEQQIVNLPGRALIGLAFDPASTATDPIMWFTHNFGGWSAAPHFSGAIARVTGMNVGTGGETWTAPQDYVIGLPRSIRDHLTNSLAFGPDGALYVTQGSISAMGARDNAWGNEPEVLLSAAVLRIDTTAFSTVPLDVTTGTPDVNGDLQDADNAGFGDPRLDTLYYNPQAPGAPVTVYASGVRNAYDLVWHTNGQLYVPTNGSAGGGNVPPTPATLPASCQNRIDAAANGAYLGPVIPPVASPITQPDYLFRVVEGGYYGHPNPTRCEWVMNGGNPTAGADPGQVGNHYPVGTQPDRNWRGAAFDFSFNKSPNGVIEYRNGTVFGGLLQGQLLVVRYSQNDDIIALEPGGPNLDIVNSTVGISGFTGFDNPLDLVENVSTGDIYLIEYGTGMNGRITLLQPGLQSIQVSPLTLTYTDLVDGIATIIQTVTISNIGSVNLTINNLALSGADSAEFQPLSAPGMPLLLAPSASTTVGVAFNAASPGSKVAALDITSNDPVNPVVSVTLDGLGINPPTASLSASLLNYTDGVGGGPSAAQSVMITNTGGLELVINSLQLNGPDAGDFQLVSPPVTPLTIPVANSATISIIFDPTTAGAKAASLDIQSNDPFNPSAAVTLNGQALAAQAGTPDISVTPGVLYFSDINGGSPSPSQTVTITNNGTGDLILNTLTLTGADAARYSITAQPPVLILAPGASTTATVNFSAADPAGLKLATLQIPSNDPDTPTATVQLRGLSQSTSGGSGEPSLQRILDVLNIPVTVGDDNVATTPIRLNGTIYPGDVLGQEVTMPLFQKAGPGPVTTQAIAAYAINGTPAAVRVGWYPQGSPATLNEVFYINSGQHQTLNPQTTGPNSFDPGATIFGLYSLYPPSPWNGRVAYSENALNTWDPNVAQRHKIRVYPLRDNNGIVPNAYVVGFEEFTSGFDYNDVVFIIRNVAPLSVAGVGGQIRTENLDWTTLNALNVPGFEYFNRWLSFSRIRNAVPNNGGTLRYHDEVTLRIHNDSLTEVLEVTGLAISDTTRFILPNGEAPSVASPLSIAPGGYYDLLVRFVEMNGLKGLRKETLTITTTDVSEPNVVVQLAGAYMVYDEGLNENGPDVISQTFGFQTNLGLPLTTDYVAHGDEILSPNWARLDMTRPVYVRQLAAFHTCCLPEPYFQIPGSGGGTFYQHRDYGQSILPLIRGTSGLPAEMAVSPANNPFTIILDGYNSNRGANGQTHGARFWAVRGPDGNIIPGAYYIVMDYVPTPCGGSVNCDFNDLIYLVANLIEALADLTVSITPPPPPAMINSNLTFTVTTSNLSQYQAVNVTTTINLPGFNIVSVNSAYGACTVTGTNVSCPLGNINGNAQKVFNVVVSTATSGNYTINAATSITSDETDETNNTATVTTFVSSDGTIPGSITIVKDASPNSPDSFSFTGTNGIGAFSLSDSGNPPFNLSVNFQNPSTTPPSGYLADFGQPYGLRTGSNQGNGAYTYGWVVPGTTTPLDLSQGGTTPGNGRNRNNPSDLRLATFMHMQTAGVPSFNGTPADGSWEIAVPNGSYQVTVSAGDYSTFDSVHTIVVEGVTAINGFVPNSSNRFASGTVTVTVNDGRLTVAATGGTNTKINYIDITSGAGNSQTFSNLSAGTYNITETVPGSWQLTGVTCNGGTTSSIANGISIQLGNGENITCTFNNLSTAASVTIDKTPATQTIISGGTANFTITVTNTGTDTLTNVAVSDALAPACSATSASQPGLASMAPGAVVTYNCALANVSASFTNTASVSGTDSGNNAITAQDTADVVVVTPAITVDKTPATQTIGSGGTANFTITVTNTGTDTLTNVTVADPLAPACTATSATRPGLAAMAPGAVVTYNCALANVSASFTNTANVSATNSGGTATTAQDTADVVVVNPAITVDKSPATQNVASGGTANFTITVTNTGTDTLTNVTVSDALAPACSADSASQPGLASMAPGAVVTYNCALANVSADFTNTVDVTALTSLGNTVTAQDTADVVVVSSDLTVEKTPATQSILNGGTASFTITVTNTGTDTLTSVTVSDPLAPLCSADSASQPGLASMAPGAVVTYNCALANVAASFTNTVDVSATNVLNNTVTAQDTADVVVVNPAIDIQKTPDNQTILVNGTANFTITVTNTGDTTLNNVAVTDPLAPNCAATSASQAGLASMAPGAVVTYNCSLANVAAGFTNTASVSGTVAATGTSVNDQDTAAVAVNNAPVANNDNYSVLQGQTLTVAVPGVLINDSDADLADTLTAVLVSGPANASSFTLNPNGSFTYTHDGSATVSDTFTYMANDSKHDSNVATVTITINAPVADVVTTKSGPTGVMPNGTITYTITATNNGPQDAQNVVITDTLPAGVTFVSASNGGTEAGGIVTWPAVTIPNGGNVVYTLQVTAPAAPGTLVNSASSTSTTNDPNPANNDGSAVGAQVSTLVNNSVLDIQKTPATQTILVNGTANFTITVTNLGNDTLTNVTVTDPQAPACAADGVTQPGLASMAPNATVTYNCSLANVAASFTNTVTATGTNSLNNPVTVQDTADVVVVSPAIDIQKGPATQTILNNGTANFTITVTNTGSTALTNVLVIDALSPACNTTIANLAAGASQTYNCSQPNVTASFTNTAAVIGTAPVGPDVTDSASADVVVNANADVVVTMSGPASVNGGDPIIYTITIINNGPNPATGVVVTDTLPAGVTFVSASNGGTHAGGVVTWPAVNIPNGGSLVYTVQVTAPNTATSLTNTASSTAASPDPNPGNNDGSDTTSQVVTAVSIPSADVVITKTGPASVNGGGAISYAVTATNNGPDAAVGVVITDTLPAGVTFVGASNGGTHAGGVVTWPAVNIPNGGSVTYNVQVTAPNTATSLTNTASSTATTVDPNPGNNDGSAGASQVVTNVNIPGADVVITKTGPASVNGGDPITYTITATNNGPDAATSVVITDTLPAGVTFVSASNGGTEAGGVVTWPAVNIPNGGNVSYTVQVTAPNAATTLTNIASSTATIADPVPANNDGSAPGSRAVTVVNVPTSADLSLTMQVSNALAQANSVVTYTLTVRNDGPADATNVVVTNPLPPDLTFQSSPDCTLVGSNVVCTTPLVSNGGSTVAFQFSAQVGINPTFTNTAEITASDQPDPDSTPANGITTEDDYAALPMNVSVFDPPSGRKVLNAVTGNAELEWRMVWINQTNTGGRVRITDTIPAGTTFVPGSIVCEDRGVSVRDAGSCVFNAGTNTVEWIGFIGPDQGATDEASANNEVIILFRLTVPDGIDSVTNQGLADADADGNGQFDDGPSASRLSNPATWNRGQAPQNPPPAGQAVDVVALTGVGTPTITKVANPPFAVPGDNVTFIFAITNTTGAPVDSVTAVDNVPPEFEILSATSQSGTVTVSGQQVTFFQPTLGNGETVQVFVETRVRSDARAPFNLVNSVCMTSAQHPTDTCASANVVSVSALPRTGESPWSKWRGLIFALAGLGLALVTVGGVRKAHRLDH